MLVKKTAKNQIVIPKALLKRAGLNEKAFSFFEIEYRSGGFFLKPMRAQALGAESELEELLDRFEQDAKRRGLTEEDVIREVKAYRKTK